MKLEHKVILGATIISAIGGVIAVAAYFDNKKHNKLNKEIVFLDKSIKELQLQKLQNNQSSGEPPL